MSAVVCVCFLSHRSHAVLKCATESPVIVNTQRGPAEAALHASSLHSAGFIGKGMVVKDALDCDIKNANQSRVRLTVEPLGCLQKIFPLYFFVFTDTTGVTMPKETEKKGVDDRLTHKLHFQGKFCLSHKSQSRIPL